MLLEYITIIKSRYLDYFKITYGDQFTLCC
nr:MAG TPA_asm: hypothetical protein [Caudoviricetes sp.]